MRAFAIVHGQPRLDGECCESLRANEPLSELGCEQMRLVAKRLLELGFKGRVYTSPYSVALESAEIISDIIDCTYAPLPCLRERFLINENTESLKGLSSEEILKKYKRVTFPFDMPYPWWSTDAERAPHVVVRLKEGLTPIFEEKRDEDILFIGHSSTVIGLRELFHPRGYKCGMHWDGSVTLLYSTGGDSFTYDVSHLPRELVTSGKLTLEESLARLEKSIADTIEAFDTCGSRVLHIGDTLSPNYPIYKHIIDSVKPDIIIHTGDMADELKAGRIESQREIWAATVPKIINIMRESGARVIVVPGNNDVESKLSELCPDFEIRQRNEIIEIDGRRICLGHEVHNLDESLPVDAFLYGHGPTGETRSPEDNERDGKLYFNVTWGPSTHSFAADKHIIYNPLCL